MVYSVLVFPLVILDNTVLLSFLDVLPVGFKGDVEERVASEDQLRRCSLVGRVDGGVNCTPDCCENSIQTEFRVEVVAATEFLDSQHVVYNLMYALHDGVSLRIACSDFKGTSSPLLDCSG